MKKNHFKERLWKNNLNYILKIMKLVVFMLTLCVTTVFSNTYSQTTRLSLSVENQNIKAIFKEIEKKSEYVFFFSDEIGSEIEKKVSVKAKNETLDKILDDVFDVTDLTYKIVDRQVSVTKKNLPKLPVHETTVENQQPEEKITGYIKDEKGEPLIGVGISVKGSSIGTTSDANGFFSLNKQANMTLVFSYISYQTREIPIGNRSSIDVTMVENPESLEEIVVVGYGRQKKISLTGAVSSISNRDILTTKSPSLAVALAGKIPGLQIRQNNGLPGSFNTEINVRGMGTPMFVIDGVIRNERTEFQKLNPEDIESVTVLKDASAAIYGINSSNGVILVKTKSGSKGPLRISYNGMVGVSSPTQHTEMMNVKQYWEVRNEDGVNSGGSPYFSSREALEEAQALPYTNWYDEVFKNQAFQQQQTLTLESGNDLISTFSSIGYTTDNGLLKSGDIGYEKYTFRNSTTVHPNKNLTVELNLSGYTDIRKQPGTWDDAFFYLNKAVHGLIPSETVYANNNQSYFNRPRPQNDNPVQFSFRDNFGYREWRDRFFQSSLALTYDIPYVKGLKVKLQAAYDAKTTIGTRVQKRVINYIYSPPTGSAEEKYTPYNNYDPSIQEEDWSTTRVNIQGHIIYNTQIAKSHNIGAVLVMEAREDNNRYLNGKRFYEGDFFTIDIIDRAPTTNQQTGGNTNKYTYLSYIGRFNYDFKDKYLLEFAFREDGTYRYAPDNRWGFFPVISAGWRMAEESFIKDHLLFITNIKPRFSYGKTAQDVGSAFQFVPGYTGYNGYVLDAGGKFISGYTSGALVNPYLTWTIAKTTDLGIDIGLWGDKLDFSFDLYRRDKEGMPATRLQALPNTFGASLPQENLNSERTEGFEIQIGHRNTVNEFVYGITGNMNIGRTQVTYKERAPFRSSKDRWKNGEVNRWTDIGWGYQVVGQYRNYDEIRNGIMETGSYGNSRTLPGDYIHLDVNGDGVINDNDRMPIFWNGQPKLSFGITTFAGWKGFDFNMLWQGAGMYSVKYNEILGNVLALDNSNSPAIYYDRWRLADIYDPDSEWIPGRYPATRRLDSDNGANRIESDIQRIDATYARLKNVELGYTVPNKSLKKTGISKMRFYVNVFNLVVLCDSYLKSFDPEITDGNGFQYPLSKSYNFGLNLTF
ncbi:SusC/RagA family TonB-linked outer membrane protein [Bacteroidia bacterium]|nr:SusC/RagA family TonB-linked outer membrane protein [Bacteroidia bacterium]